MNDKKIKDFMTLAGQSHASEFVTGTPEQRTLGAQLLLSEVLEYVIKGLGVTPSINGVSITAPDALTYQATATPNRLEMLDGLCDVAYTMYWNAVCFGIPLEEGFDAVCDNNLEKFVQISESNQNSGALDKALWHCGKNITWPESVTRVEAIRVGTQWYAVGKDASGKVRKPSSYKSVELQSFL